jgi:NADPH2:quinone reductase
VLVFVVQVVGTQRGVQVVHQRDVASVVQALTFLQQAGFGQQGLGVFVAGFGQVYLTALFVGGEVAGGTFADLVAAPVRTLAHKPSSLSFEEAAAVPLAGLTAYQTIRRAGVQSGHTVLVHAAAGGVGSFAVQIARSLGARVIGTASESNHDYLRTLGAEPTTYGDGLADRVRALDPAGVDVVLDYVGGEALDSVPDVLRDGGTVASIIDARARDEFGGQYAWVRPDSADLAELARLADAGDLKPEIAEVFDLADAAGAHERSQSGHVRGKIVVRVSTGA